MPRIKQKCSPISHPCKTKKGNIVCIPKDKKCASKQKTISNLQSPKTVFYKDKTFQRNMAIAGVSSGVVAAAIAGSVLVVQNDLKKSSVPFDSIRQPPDGGKPDAQTLAKYDTFEPGDLIRKNFKSDRLGTRQHYGVYIGKDPDTGDHLLIDTGENWKSRDSVPFVQVRGLTWPGPDGKFENDSEYEKVPIEETGLVEGVRPISKAEAVKRAEKMLYQHFEYQGFSSNCEAFARGIVEGKAYSSQGLNNSPLTNFVSEVVTNNVLKLRTKSPSPDHARAFETENEKTIFSVTMGKGEQAKRVEITGLTDYALDPYKMTAQQMVDYLAQQEVMEARRGWESTKNPYSGFVEQGGYLTKKQERSQQAIGREAVEEFKRKGVSPSEAWRLVLTGIGNRKDSLKFSEIGIRDPLEYELIVNEIAGKFPSASKPIKIKLIHNYLMAFFALFSSNTPTPREDSEVSESRLKAVLKKLVSKAYMDGLDEIGEVKISDNGNLKFVGRDGARVLEFKLAENNLSYKVLNLRKDSYLVDQIREDRATRRRGKERQCKKGIPCGDTCISPKRTCNLDLNQLSSPGEQNLIQKLIAEAKIERESFGKKTEAVAPTESQEPREDYVINPETGKEYTIRELKSKARDRDIYNYSLMTKEELRQSLQAADSNPEQQNRIGKTLIKERGPSQKAIRSSGLQGGEKKSAQEAARTYKNLQMLAKFAGSQPVGWGVAATGAFLMGASLRAYENTKGNYQSYFKENAEEAERIAATLGRNAARGAANNKMIRTRRNNITFVIAPHKGQGGSQAMIDYLRNATSLSQDPGERWLNSDQEFIAFNLKESGARLGGSDIENAVNGLTDYVRNLRRRKDQDAVELAAQIYAYGIQPKTSSIEAQLDQQYRRMLGSEGRYQANLNQLLASPQPGNPKWMFKRQKAELQLRQIREEMRKNRNRYQKEKGKGNYEYANRDKKINILTHSRSGQTAKTAMAYLEKMHIPGELTGKEILEQVNVVALGTPHFGFTDPGKYNFRTIISSQDPVSMLPVWGSGARQQWISSVEGHSFRDYLSNPDVRESLREVFGYYGDSLVEQLRKQRGRAYRTNSVIRIDRKKKPKCSPKSQLCGQRCIPKDWNCKSKSSSPSKKLSSAQAIAIGGGATVAALSGSLIASAYLGRSVMPSGVAKSSLSTASPDLVKGIRIDREKPAIAQGATSHVAFVTNSKNEKYVYKQMIPVFSHQVVSEAFGSQIAEKAGIPTVKAQMVAADDMDKLAPSLNTKKAFGIPGSAVLMSIAPGKPLTSVQKTGKFQGLNMPRSAGLRDSNVRSLAMHPDLPKIAAFDTFTSNWDRSNNNLFYDEETDRFTAIDNGNAFMDGKFFPDKNVPLQSRKYLEGKKKEDFSEAELNALKSYRDTLKTLFEQNPPEKTKKIYSAYFGVAGLNWKFIEKFVNTENVGENYKQTQSLLKELDKLLS